MEKEDFIRNRKLTFSMIIVMILRGHKMSLQSTVNKVLKKLKAEVFV